MKITCKICDKEIGTGSNNDTGMVCSSCAESLLLVTALANGTNQNVENLFADDKPKMKKIIKEALFDTPDKVLLGGYGNETETVKGEVDVELGLDKVKAKGEKSPNEVKVDIYNEAKAQGEDADTITKAKMKIHKDKIEKP